MNNFDVIMNKARELVNVASKKTNEVISISKLKMEHLNMTTDLQKKYENLGMLCYREFKTSSDNSAAIKQLVQEIDELSIKIDQYKDEISKIKNMIICPICGNRNLKNSVYCSACGSPLYPNKTDSSENNASINIEYHENEVEVESEHPKSEPTPDINDNK